MGTVAEIVIYLYDSKHRTLFLPDLLYRARFIYIPTSLNLAVILATAFCLKSKRISNMAKNTWACILIYFLCANTQVIHYVYGPLLMLPTIAIFVTVLFANKRLTRGISIASLVSLLIASLQASRELRKDDPQLVSDVVLAVLVMLVAYIASRLLTRYVSEQISYILHSNERQKLLIEECNMDPLMGIGNRRALNDRLNEIVNQKEEADLSLLLFDIDNFKHINDEYGHLCGDEVLIALAGEIRQAATGKHLEAFRYGGDEIVLVIHGLPPDEAYRRCEDLRTRFSAICYTFSTKSRFTLSGGFVSYTLNMSAEDWLKDADDALYEAKREGKNRIHIFKE